jgi:hypothetical protein
MKRHEIERRELLRLLASLPIGLAIGCGTGESIAPARGAPLSPRDSLRKLVLLLGPWSDTDRGAADDFVRRFLAAEPVADPYLTGSAALLQSLASRFPDGTMALQEVDLGSLPPEDRDLLIALAKQLYSFVEVRFLLSGDRPYGQCQGDPLRHTRAPAQGES